MDIIDIIRNAEVSAQEKIEEAKQKADRDVAAAENKSKFMICTARQEAEALAVSSRETAGIRANEIIASAVNSARSCAEKLRNNSKERQQEINELIVSLIL